MLRLKPDHAGASPLQVLCLGCHSDDIEIGCGGTVLKIAAEYPDAVFHWVVFSANGVRAEEAASGARHFVDPARMKRVILKEFRDGYMPFVGADIKNVFEEIKREVSPDIIFTQNRHDSHQDHRLIAELTWNTFRSHFILEYEIPKYDGDLGQPNVFNALPSDICEQKVGLILNTFKSQADKHWFDRTTFMALMRLRGMECNAPSGYAEAFYARKLML